MKTKKRGWIFFDIDGTLLHARGSGRDAFQIAFKEALGWDQNVEHITFCGATDLAVFRAICADRGDPSTPEMEQRFFDALAPALDQQLAKNPPHVFPSIEKTLELLSSGWKLGLVTGNIDATARLKLTHANLLNYFDNAGMGFGCDHADRAEIARRALERAGNPQRAVLIGDTPEDIRAAKANQMVSIGVATGAFDVSSLEQSGADFVFKNLKETTRLLSILNTL